MANVLSHPTSHSLVATTWHTTDPPLIRLHKTPTRWIKFFCYCWSHICGYICKFGWPDLILVIEKNNSETAIKNNCFHTGFRKTSILHEELLPWFVCQVVSENLGRKEVQWGCWQNSRRSGGDGGGMQMWEQHLLLVARLPITKILAPAAFNLDLEQRGACSQPQDMNWKRATCATSCSKQKTGKTDKWQNWSRKPAMYGNLELTSCQIRIESSGQQTGNSVRNPLPKTGHQQAEQKIPV